MSVSGTVEGECRFDAVCAARRFAANMTEHPITPSENEERADEPITSDNTPTPPEPSSGDASEPDAPPAGINAVNLPDDISTDEQLAAAYEETMKNIQESEVVRGQVLKVAGDSALVDIGYKSEGVIPLREFPFDADGNPLVKEGDEVDVYIVRLEDANGSLVLSKAIADQRRVWDDIAAAYEANRPVKGVARQRTKGGLRVEIDNMTAFLPASQIDIRPVKDLDLYIGRELEMRVIKLNRRRRNIVLSRRALLEEEREAMRQELLMTLAPGQIRRGVVKNIMPFGAFIDLGGLDGLLHRSEMSWGRVHDASDFVERDQELDVMVLNVNRESGKVSLGLKQLTRNPWADCQEKYKAGLDVQGRVVNILEYGAFVELEKGVEGLVHTSQMSWTRRGNIDPYTILQVGEEVTVRILEVDPERQKISLGLKQVGESPWERLERENPVGSRVTGKVQNFTDFGVFVTLEGGIDGLIHVTDLSWTKRLEPREMMQVGDDIDVVILKIDRDRERVSLGVKQLEPDPWLQVPQKYKVGTATQAHIVDIVDFGAFAKLEGGIEGLIHISELSDQHVNSPGEVVRVGDVIDVKVINIDLQDRRIGLSRKAYLAEGHRLDAEDSSADEASAGRQEQRRQDTEERTQPTGRTLADLVDEAQAKREESDGNNDSEE